jgi:hypothetical protein
VSKHTPGPWEVEEQNWCGHRDCPHGHTEVLVNGPDGLPLHRWQADYGLELARANARLIAAAPDLLAALSACEIAMDTAAYSGLHGLLSPAYRESWAVAHRGAKAVLARLTGGVP